MLLFLLIRIIERKREKIEILSNNKAWRKINDKNKNT